MPNKSVLCSGFSIKRVKLTQPKGRLAELELVLVMAGVVGAVG